MTKADNFLRGPVYPESSVFNQLRNEVKLDADAKQWHDDIKRYQEFLLSNERNNGQNDVFEALREIWDAGFYGYNI
mgnify:CR=1 FL=1